MSQEPNDKPRKIYILSMERTSDREGHHYNCGLYSDLAAATIEGLSRERFRANKYEMRIEICSVDNHDSPREVSRQVAVDFAKLKFPEKFDDRSQLKDDDND